MAEINKNFAKERRSLYLTQGDVALAIGVSRFTYIKWENDPDTMPIGRYEEVIEFFAKQRAKREELTGEV